MSYNVEYRKWPGAWSSRNSSLRSQHMHAHLCTTHTHILDILSPSRGRVFCGSIVWVECCCCCTGEPYLNEVATKKYYSQTTSMVPKAYIWVEDALIQMFLKYWSTCFDSLTSCTLQVAKKLGPGHTIVTCLCDSGQVSDVIALTINFIHNNSLLCSDTLQDFLIESGWKWKVF